MGRALAEGYTSAGARSDEKVQNMAEIMFPKRMADPDEMVGPALLLTSDTSSFITGQILIVDGGMVVAR